jgi:hypothetical protein
MIFHSETQIAQKNHSATFQLVDNIKNQQFDEANLQRLCNDHQILENLTSVYEFPGENICPEKPHCTRESAHLKGEP